MPLALETVVKQLADSGIVAPGKLENFVPPKAHPKDAEALLRELHKQNLLTRFQAQQVAAGKTKALILGEYTILDKIGAGGMGQVFKALHRRMERVVAIKMLPPTMTKDAAALARFQREVVAAAKLEHPNIVHANDAGQAGNAHFLVMQYVEGSDLSALVKKNGPFSVEKAVDYILQAAKGLEYAHRRGVIHRDIKPANLLLDAEGTVKILDMGLARIEAGGDAATQAELTGTGAVMGTVDYMAPEQARSTHHADARADIYSLGCSLFYLLTARPLYAGETITNKLISHQFDPIPSFRETRDDVPETVEAIYQKMVAKKVEDRYQTMTEVIADLQPLVAGGSTMNGRGSGTTDAATSNSNLTFLNEIPAHTVQRKSTRQIKAVASSGSKNKKLALIVAGVISAVILLAAIIVSLRTQDGTLIVEVDQPDVMVQVLDAESKVEVSEKGGAGKVTISVDPGKHRLKVEKDGFTTFGQEFEIKKGGRKEITAKLLPIGYALKFNGTINYVVTPVRYDGNHPITIEALVETASPSLLHIVSNAEGYYGIALWVQSGTLIADVRSNARVEVRSAAPLTSGQKTHIAASYDGSDIRLFVDGVLQGMKSGSYTKSPIPIVIGANPDGPLMKPPFFNIAAATFHGTIDEVRISKVARYTSNFTPEPRFTPDADTIALYHFDEGSGDTAFDSSDNKHHAKIVGAKWVRANASESSKPWNTPAFQKWMKDVVAMPAEQQVEAVTKKLVELNPGFDGKVTGGKGIGTPKIENDMVTELGFVTDDVTDISPVRALVGLKSLTCTNSQRKGKLSDLSPLAGMPLTSLNLVDQSVSDLSPLRGMPLTQLTCFKLSVSDLSPLAGMPLTQLICRSTKVTDLSPLEDCKSLTSLQIEKTRVTAASVAALQKALPNCKIFWDEPGKTTSLTPPSATAPPLAKAPFNAKQARAHQEAWAKHLGIEVETTNSVGMKMVLIPPGEFLMGSTDEQVEAALKVAEAVKADRGVMGRIEQVERPQHKVVITKPFLMGATKVTVGQFKKFSATGYITEAEKAEAVAKATPPPIEVGQTPPKPIPTYLNPGYTVTDDSPAAVIAWNDATAYCQWLSNLEKRTYRLPTEAEWEYACRAGTTTQYSFGDDIALLDQYGWYVENGGSRSHTVGTKPSNGFGLFDMHGNLYDWCGDFYEARWYDKSPQTDPIGPASGSSHVTRSGSWNSTAFACRSAYRSDGPLSYRGSSLGFRIVRELVAPSKTASVTPQPTVPAAAPTKPITDFNSPEFQAWIKEVQAMPAEEQVKAVSKKLVELNPGFDGKVIHKNEGEFVTELELVTDSISDISPVRALAALRTLHAYGSAPVTGKVADLSPLKGLPLTYLRIQFNNLTDLSPLMGMKLNYLLCSMSNVADLSPLKGMPLTQLNCEYTQVGDLSPLKGMPLKTLHIQQTLVGNLSPLEGMTLEEIRFSPAKITAGLEILRSMKSLNTIGIDWQDEYRWTPEEFWKKYDASKFGKPLTDIKSPAFQQWMKNVQALPAEEQVKEVVKKLMELNPEFDGQVTHKAKGNEVTVLEFVTAKVTDISPVRVFAGLKVLHLHGPNGTLFDLSPLEGMSLTTLSCGFSEVSNLSPLAGIPTLTILYCGNTRISDLTPLAKCKSLAFLDIKGTKVTPASVAALQKALPNCKVDWDDPAKATTPQPAASGTK